MTKCHKCGYIYDENNHMGFTLPYGFKSVKTAIIKIFFCPECEVVQFADGETSGSFDSDGKFIIENQKEYDNMKSNDS